MRLLDLYYFCAVARCRNMNDASRELAVSQPSLSKAVNNLEDELGVKLFDRVGRGIQLNEYGTEFYQQVSRVLVLLEDAVAQVKDDSKRRGSELNVLFTAATFIAPKIKAQFCKNFPETNVRLFCSYSATPREIRNCDIYIYASPVTASGMTSIPLIEEPMVIACSPEHPLAARGTIDLIETQPYQYMCLPPHENMHENMIIHAQRAGFTPNIGFCTEDSYAFISALSSSDMLCMVPKHSAFADAPDLVKLDIRKPACKRTIYMAAHQGGNLSEKALSFWLFCVDYFKKLSAER